VRVAAGRGVLVGGGRGLAVGDVGGRGICEGLAAETRLIAAGVAALAQDTDGAPLLRVVRLDLRTLEQEQAGRRGAAPRRAPALALLVIPRSFSSYGWQAVQPREGKAQHLRRSLVLAHSHRWTPAPRGGWWPQLAQVDEALVIQHAPGVHQRPADGDLAAAIAGDRGEPWRAFPTGVGVNRASARSRASGARCPRGWG
jgi:hypothetical protein